MSDMSFHTRGQINGKRIWFKPSFSDKNAYNKICAAKTRLMREHPFWGFMGLDLTLVEAPAGSGIRTLATDGYHIFYNAEFVEELTPGEVEFGVAHEVYHCIFGHTQGEGKVRRRHDDWDSRMWNRACDYVINYDLKQAGVGEFITTIDILYHEPFGGMSAEEVYKELESGNDPQPDTETMDTHIEVEIVPDDATGSNGGDEEGEGNNGNGDGQDGEGDGDESGNGGGSIKIKMTESQMADELARWQRTTQRAVATIKNNGQAAGGLPEHVQRMIDELRKPKIKFGSLLRRFVTQFYTSGYTFIRPDKRTFGTSITLPSNRRKSDKLTIAVAIDTSGSIRNEALTKFISELFGILRSFRKYEVHVFCFEGTVDHSTYMKITGTAEEAKQKLGKYIEKVKGGGGTLFQSVWDFLREKRINPKGLVFFTDGYPCDDSWEQERGIPTLFVTVDNHDGWQAPFGRTIAYENVK